MLDERLLHSSVGKAVLDKRCYKEDISAISMSTDDLIEAIFIARYYNVK
jgi:hypothetical protein